MDGRIVIPSACTEYFDSACPYYMAIGMSYEEYWYGKPEIAKFYKEKDIYRRRMKNEEMWIEGLYFAKAISTNFSKKEKYPEKPFDIFPKTTLEKQAEAQKEREKIIDYFTQLKQMWENKNGNNR